MGKIAEVQEVPVEKLIPYVNNAKMHSDEQVTMIASSIRDDVSINIYAWIKAQETQREVNLCCAIGDEIVDGRPYSEIVDIARNYIASVGGFEKFAEWGLLRVK